MRSCESSNRRDELCLVIFVIFLRTDETHPALLSCDLSAGFSLGTEFCFGCLLVYNPARRRRQNPPDGSFCLLEEFIFLHLLPRAP